MGNDFVKFPDHISVSGLFGQIDQSPVAGVEGEWGFLRLGRALSLNVGFSYATSLSPASLSQSNLWGYEVSRYAGHLGMSYRLILFPGRSISLGLTPMARLFFGAQSYSPKLTENKETLRSVCEEYERWNSTTGRCSVDPSSLEPYPTSGPSGTSGIIGLQAGGSFFISIDGSKLISGLGPVDFFVGIMADTSGAILAAPGLQGNF